MRYFVGKFRELRSAERKAVKSEKIEMSEFTETIEILKNGAELISFSAPSLHTAAFSVVLPFVPQEKAGIYHFAEHMFFERAGGKRAADINGEMSSRGSEIMGYTTKNHMCFNFTCRKEVFADQLGLLYSMLTQKEYGKEEFESVMAVIRNEIYEYEFYDNRAADILREEWYDARFCPSVLGTLDDLAKITSEDLEKTRQSLFNRGMKIFLAGGFSESDKRLAEKLFGMLFLLPYEYSAELKVREKEKSVCKKGRGKNLQVLVTYHVTGADEELKAAASWLKSALFDGMDAQFLKFFEEHGFHFYSVEGNYSVQGDEIVFSWLTYIKRKEKKKFMPLIDKFERSAEKTAFLKLVKPFLWENMVFLYDNPERLCSHYADTYADLGEAVTLTREREMYSSFTDEKLAEAWRKITRSARKIYLIGG